MLTTGKNLTRQGLMYSLVGMCFVYMIKQTTKDRLLKSVYPFVSIWLNIRLAQQLLHEVSQKDLKEKSVP